MPVKLKQYTQQQLCYGKLTNLVDMTLIIWGDFTKMRLEMLVYYLLLLLFTNEQIFQLVLAGTNVLAVTFKVLEAVLEDTFKVLEAVSALV